MYNNAKDLLAACDNYQATIAHVTLLSETEKSDIEKTEIRKELVKRLRIMKESATRGRIKPTYSLSGLTGGNAYKLSQYLSEESFSGDAIVDGMSYAMSTSEINASMGRIVAAPTAGAAGILPAALLVAEEQFQFNEETLVDGLLTASAVGNIIATNATVSGAEGGCQAECGAAAAMAAAALVSMKNSEPKLVLNGACFALINVMGLVCDPVGGLVEFPCALRNAGGLANALSAADLALAGVDSLVSFDEVVNALYQVGTSLSVQLRETGLGGIAAEPSAQQACRQCLKK